MTENTQVATNTDSQKDTTTDYSKLPLEKRTTVKDVSDKERQLMITETDGTTIEVNIKQPSLRMAETIDDARSEMAVNTKGVVTGIQSTTAKFHEALFSMFSAPVLVDSKPAGKIDWGFGESHKRETFDWLMAQAETFLDSRA